MQRLKFGNSKVKKVNEADQANNQKENNPRPFEIAAGGNVQPGATVQTEVGFERIGCLTFRTG